jgi:hypothetical protein
MPRPRCQKPLTKIINVGAFEAGIVAFETIMKNLAESERSDEHELATQLLAKVREHGNYISSTTEELYRVALLGEFTLFVGKEGQRK